jgi:uncharacterized protein (UPF0276 family)
MTVHFAINYSPQAAKLLKNSQIEIDYFKTPPWPDMIAKAETLRPIAVHFDLRPASLDKLDWSTIDEILAITSTTYINFHLGVKVVDMPHFPVNEMPGFRLREQLVEQLIASVQKMCEYFGAERVIVENVPFRLNENTTLMACVDPDLISKVLETTGCGFLLDVSHARISAHYLGMDAKEYIESLPVNQLREIHFSGIHDWDGYRMDHLPILEDDWYWLDWVLNKVRVGRWGQAHMLAFEYGGIGEFYQKFSDPEVIADQVPRLYGACHQRE